MIIGVQRPIFDSEIGHQIEIMSVPRDSPNHFAASTAEEFIALPMRRHLDPASECSNDPASLLDDDLCAVRQYGLSHPDTYDLALLCIVAELEPPLA